MMYAIHRVSSGRLLVPRTGTSAICNTVVTARKGQNKSDKPTKQDLPSKTCLVCGRPFVWRKKWESCWDEVKYCSERCRRQRGSTAVQAVGTDAAERSSSNGAASSTHDNKAVPLFPASDIQQLLDQDAGGIVHMEHINLQVPDLELARLFYAEGLGLTPDPGVLSGQRGGVGVVWYNIGRQQFHIVKGPDVQQTDGVIVLHLTHLSAVQQQLTSLKNEPLLKGSRFDVCDEVGGSGLMVTDPWGQQFIVREACPKLPSGNCIASVTMPCHVGTSHAIGEFYRRVFQARVELTAGKCVLYTGPFTELVFGEQDELGPYNQQGVMSRHDGWHLALYVTNFSSSFSTLNRMSLVTNDHPFSDKIHTLQDLLKYQQFRVQDIVALEDLPGSPTGGGVINKGEVLYRVQHEVRSTRHPRFMRPLYNRHGSNFDVR